MFDEMRMDNYKWIKCQIVKEAGKEERGMAAADEQLNCECEGRKERPTQQYGGGFYQCSISHAIHMRCLSFIT